MSKASLPPSSAGRGSERGRYVEYDQFIDQQVDKTRSHVRGIDITGAVMTLAAGTLVFFLAATVLDHWIVPGGLGFWGRFLLWSALVCGVCYYAATELFPLFLRRINPVYAAHAIERGTPSLKNGLVNFLLLKGQRTGVSQSVFDAIEEQAATGLARASVESTVDRSRLVKLGYVLVALVALAAFYKVLSPKDPLATVGRVILPWSDIQAPTRVIIRDVTPGTADAFRGQQVEVSADVRGLKSDGEVRLIFGTADGQIVNQVVRMTMPATSMRYACKLPESAAGLQQDLVYHIEAGDAQTKPYRLTVVAAPTIVVQAVDYVFPDYTGLAAQRLEQQGDIKGIEGTQVTLHALANQEIKSGVIDFNCDGREDQQLSIDGRNATVTFTLEMAADRKTPTYNSYQLRFRNAANQENPQPIAHRIEVTPDLAPEIEFLHPKSPELDVPARSSVAIEIVANDPDFALRRVQLVTRVGEKLLYDKLLLDEARAGQFSKKLWFGTGRSGLKVGDVIEYWAVAEDIKSPKPNHVETPHRKLRIVSPQQQKPADDQIASRDDEIRSENSGKNKPDDDQQADSKQDDRNQGRPQNPGQQGSGGNKSDGQNRPNARGDNDNEDRQPKNADGQNEESRDKNGQQSGEQPKQGEQQSGDGPGEQGQQGGQKQKGGQSGGQGGSGDEDNGVASDGSDDGSAIEKILNDRQKNEKSDGKGDGVGDKSQSNGQDSGSDQTGNDQGNNSSQRNNQGKQDGGSAKSAGQKDATSQAKKDGSGQSRSQPGDKVERPDGQSGRKSPDQSERDSQNPGPSGHSPIREQTGDKGTGGNPNKGLGQQGPGDRPGTTEGKQDDTQSPNEPGGSGAKKEPSAPGDSKPADRSEQGSAPGAQQRRPGKRSNEPGDPREQGGAGDGQSQPDNDNTGDKNSPIEKGNPNDRGQQQGERMPGRPDEPSGGQKGEQAGDSAERGQKQDGGQQGLTRKPRPGEKAKRTEPGHGEPGEGAERSSGEKSGQRSGQRPNEKPEQQPESPEAGQQQGERSGPGDSQQKSNNPQDQGQQPGSGQGKGGRSEGGTGRKPQQSPADKQPNPDAKGGDGDDNKGQSGAGNSSQDKKGSPAAQGNNQQRDKTQQGGGRNAMQPNDAAESPSNSERQSDSQGESSGDRSGGGGKGGGQKANKSGTGGAGQNTASDEGAGKSDQVGDGETGDKAGDQQESDGATGQSGTKRGKGSSSRGNGSSGGDGQKPPGEAGQNDANQKGPQQKQQPDGKPQQGQPGEKQLGGQPPNKQQPGGKAKEGERPKDAGQPGDQSSGGPGGPAGGQPRGGGSGPQQQGAPEAQIDTPEDDPNLDYARKATDLALDHLKNQLDRGEVDQELLDKLKWTRQDAERFVKRLEEMRHRANQRGETGETGRQELDDYLRSLGIRPRSSRMQADIRREDQTRGMKESRRSEPPAEYAEQFKAYTQGTSRNGK